MKLATKKNTYHTSQVQESYKYKVASSVHMMTILSDSLYSDKISAVIRELSTNAYDSHVLAGCMDKPFDVHLPTSDNLVFRIRDYGTGLSKSDIVELYTVYGRSNKTNSNDIIGCLGLGSKSVFCYTNMFTTISYFNGMKYVFVNSTDQRGCPTCNLMHSEPTDEPNGLEISMDVKQEDYREFATKAVNIYKWFNVCPNINRNVVIDICNFQSELKTYIYKGDDWLIRGQYKRDACVIMGQVAYNLEAKHFSGPIRELINNGLILYVGLGDVDMDASREALQYNEHTIRYIKSKINNILYKLRKDLETELATAPTLWDARVMASETWAVGDKVPIVRIISPDCIYNGQKLDIKQLHLDSKSFFKFSMNSRKVSLNRKCDRILVRKSTKFVVNDSTGLGHAQLRRYIIVNNDINNFYLYTPIESKSDSIKNVVDITGINPNDILFTSSFPKPPKQQRVAGQKVPDSMIGCHRLGKFRYGYAKQNYFNSDTVDLNKDKGYYLEHKSYSILCNGKEIHPSTICTQIENNIGADKLICVTKTRLSKVESHNNWEKVEVFIKNTLDKWFSSPDNVEQMERTEHEDIYNSYKSIVDKLDKNTKMYKFLSQYQVSKSDINKMQGLMSLYQTLTGNEYKVPPSVSNTLSSDIRSHYPMLKLVNMHQINRYNVDNKNVQIVADYINQLG